MFVQKRWNYTSEVIIFIKSLLRDFFDNIGPGSLRTQNLNPLYKSHWKRFLHSLPRPVTMETRCGRMMRCDDNVATIWLPSSSITKCSHMRQEHKNMFPAGIQGNISRTNINSRIVWCPHISGKNITQVKKMLISFKSILHMIIYGNISRTYINGHNTNFLALHKKHKISVQITC